MTRLTYIYIIIYIYIYIFGTTRLTYSIMLRELNVCSHLPFHRLSLSTNSSHVSLSLSQQIAVFIMIFSSSLAQNQ
ncbi:hypothetical protein RchiOBHm_Chr2g0109791 [Rosa chinensis]|uniref:Uncharacterized protein n=1 Tax=Rosa chinensis TaxID=74649 RepID=A0A2P6RPJ7_ROSCH|nr:hypothetical protein RchiOBHm_Chr2g0109791 [Rosa chinensis]